MPKNKLASFRYRVINNCLRNTGRKWTRQDLIDEISNQLYEHFGIEKGISKRTFQYDINLMRSLPPRGFDAPIIEKDGCYFYEDPDFSIDHKALSENDVEAINNALTILKNFPKLAIHEELALVQAKFQDALSFDQENEPSIWFEQKQVTGTDFIAPIYKAIQTMQALELCYKPFKSPKPNSFIVHPYLLKQYNHRWYLIGYCSTYQSVGFYSLDRIKSLKKAKESYTPNKFFNPDTYFKDIIGITVKEGEPVKDITIRVSGEQAPYIETKPLHHTQKVIRQLEDGIEISLRLIPNYEFYSLVLNYGSTLEVISPKKVREKMIETIQKMNQIYEVKK